uniref:NADH dehydrogenase subunit 6 n=1 Tax=Arion vulgaris TaxID=1028688 RepID=A0A6C0AB43_9EUPU|nr:NADH dehydrogenase subunit 6 [Arion vulgaris]QHS71048.1 NADH dehydrogenase subunit 6 [Arion vulgaris]
MKYMLLPIMYIMLVVLLLLSLRNPLMVSMALFLLSFLYSIMLSYMYNSWYAMILFLVYIGGLLVLLMYTTLTSSNYTITTVNMNSMGWLIMMSFSFLPYTWIEMPEATSAWIQITSQASTMSPMFIVMLGVLLFYMFLMVVFILYTGGKSLQLARTL